MSGERCSPLLNMDMAVSLRLASASTAVANRTRCRPMVTIAGLMVGAGAREEGGEKLGSGAAAADGSCGDVRG